VASNAARAAAASPAGAGARAEANSRLALALDQAAQAVFDAAKSAAVNGFDIVSGLTDSVGSIATAYSNNSPRGTWLYQLIHVETGEIMKFGITSLDNPRSRYPEWYYNITNTRIEPLSYEPNRAVARGKAYMLCTGYVAATNHKPALSFRC
jgi:hypothetical protein